MPRQTRTVDDSQPRAPSLVHSSSRARASSRSRAGSARHRRPRCAHVVPGAAVLAVLASCGDALGNVRGGWCAIPCGGQACRGAGDSEKCSSFARPWARIVVHGKASERSRSAPTRPKTLSDPFTASKRLDCEKRMSPTACLLAEDHSRDRVVPEALRGRFSQGSASQARWRLRSLSGATRPTPTVAREPHEVRSR